MHIEPGVVTGAKILISYATAAAAMTVGLKHMIASQRENGVVSFALRSVIATILVFVFFEVLPHYPVGVSEVHLILGTTLLLVFGVGPTAVGLLGGLLIQGLFFAPFDLPQLGMNATTLLVPLYAVHLLAKRVIPAATAYVDVGYKQVFMLSAAYQGGIVLWVAFWALLGQGFAANNLAAIGSFGAAYLLVILLEPLIDLAVLAGAKALRGLDGSPLVTRRLHHGAM